MAPEVLADAEYSPRSDQYALAVSVYEVISGEHPFAGSNLYTLRDAFDRGHRKLADLNGQIPAAASAAVDRALSMAPENRFASCQAFATAFIDGLKAKPSVVSPTPATGEDADTSQFDRDEYSKQLEGQGATGDGLDIAGSIRGGQNSVKEQKTTLRSNNGKSVGTVWWLAGAVAICAAVVAGLILNLDGDSGGNPSKQTSSNQTVTPPNEAIPTIPTSIQIDGSTATMRLLGLAAGKFKDTNSNVDVSIDSSGSGMALKRLAQGELDICGTSRPMKQSERRKCAEFGVDFDELKLNENQFIYLNRDSASRDKVEQFVSVLKDFAESTPFDIRKDYLSVHEKGQVSPSGLIFDKNSVDDRVDKVLSHFRDQANRPIHGVFEGSEFAVFETVLDHAFRAINNQGLGNDLEISKKESGSTGTVEYTIDFKRKIGFEGGRRGNQNGNPPLTKLRLVLRDGNRVVTAFPTK